MEEIRHNSVILAIDDNPTNLKLLHRLLSARGYQNVHLLSDSREAVNTFLDLQPDLILLDINMPDLDGFEVMDALFALNLKLMPPIVIISAQQSIESTLTALRKGARDYVSKPFEKNELLMRVQNLLDAHLAHKMLNDQAQVLEQMVNHRTKELHSTRLSVVQRLGMAAEYKDEETGNHILRMSHICMLLAQQLGWSDYRCKLLLHASPMHDIGKIGIPDSILLKEGPLDPQQWEIMKTHAQIGGELLGGDNSDLMIMARSIALTHHEKYNGTGYPHGLQQEEIPIEGRIAAIADVYDALTSARPYKQAWSTEAALNYIKEQSGQHFDPTIAEIFLSNVQHVLHIKNRFQD
ncbi:Cyclic di-GMP phosphodiesterase response regulator RpfG [Pseudoalteromonas holothuriae]|uniref:Cyclic di-GMP phosphodiesterase response regulator RpfG n=1 Tax=Pseudoalteromonas holothuriae TaxID=2963714 RepID=A0A9W4QUY1_9GAMM|nr:MULTISPECIES: HD domain-containing phosphohydrolase [unclassified Pseudoalteromonas]CAH9053877.1 Cyclic di-GMP phosphodiesterase response regulator RpfG [Pseudoalteromonas sp. CIP111854]CAH9060966.1 Cyclic di-GMP phosphodiesterase response regulator RpfG [Pseudoalteromonas sp. CIP111951]